MEGAFHGKSADRLREARKIPRVSEYKWYVLDTICWACTLSTKSGAGHREVFLRDHNCIAKVDSGNKASTGEERHPWRGADEEQQMLFKAVMFKPQGRCKDTDLWESKAVAQYPLRTLQWRQNSMRTSNLETVVSWLLAQPVVLDLPHAATP